MVELGGNVPRRLNRRWIFASHLANFAIYSAIMLTICSAPWDWAVAVPFVFPWGFFAEMSYKSSTKLGTALFCGLTTLAGVLISIPFSLIWPRRLSLLIAHLALFTHWSWSIWIYCQIRGMGSGGFMRSGAW